MQQNGCIFPVEFYAFSPDCFLPVRFILLRANASVLYNVVLFAKKKKE